MKSYTSLLHNAVHSPVMGVAAVQCSNIFEQEISVLGWILCKFTQCNGFNVTPVN